MITLCLHSQKDTANIAFNSTKKNLIRETSLPNINIFPVPVRESSFTIRTDREISTIKVTNMIGQEIYRMQYRNPLPSTKVMLENPTRGIYLVTISFVDGTRVVRKIMVEIPE